MNNDQLIKYVYFEVMNSSYLFNLLEHYHLEPLLHFSQIEIQVLREQTTTGSLLSKTQLTRS